MGDWRVQQARVLGDPALDQPVARRPQPHGAVELDAVEAPGIDIAEEIGSRAGCPAPVERENPGLFNEFNKLFKDTPSLMPSWSLPSLGSGNLNTVVKGRVVCPLAANGAPDCKAASDRLCQSKGYKEGNSLDTDAAQTCSPKAMIPGRQPEPGDCRTDNYVTQAVCK
jgi:hypothetical protein